MNWSKQQRHWKNTVDMLWIVKRKVLEFGVDKFCVCSRKD